MDAKIIKNIENRVLGRKEITCEVSFSKSTPTRKELKELICGKVGAHPDMSVLREVHPTFGKQGLVATVHSYSTKEAVLKGEPHHLLVRDGLATKKPKKEKKKAPPAAKK
jgi:ribosomal protein S24E